MDRMDDGVDGVDVVDVVETGLDIVMLYSDHLKFLEKIYTLINKKWQTTIQHHVAHQYA